MDTGFLNPMPLQVINQELSVPGLASTCVEGKSFICNLVETTSPFPLFNLATNFKFCSSHLLCNVDRSLRVEREWAAQKPRLAVRQRHEDDHLVLSSEYTILTSLVNPVSFTWMYLSTVPPVSTASSSSSAAFFPTASPEIRGEPSADPPRMHPVLRRNYKEEHWTVHLVRATTTIPDPLPVAALASSL